jgi:signal transduction histidine kinase
MSHVSAGVGTTLDLNERLGTLMALSRAVSSSLDVDEALGAVTRAATEVTSPSVVALWTADEETGTLVCAATSDEEVFADFPAKTVRFDHQGFVGEVARTRRSIHVRDAVTDSRVLFSDWCRRHGLRTVDAIPILFQDAILGVLVYGRQVVLPEDDEAHQVLAFVVDQAAIAIRNARLYADAERRRQTAERLADVGRLISQSLDLQLVAQHMVDNLRALVPGLRAAFYRGDPDSEDFHLVAESNDRTVTMAPNIVFRRGTGTVGHAARERRLIVTPNLLTDARFRLEDDVYAQLARTPVRAVAAVPLLASDSIVGVLIVADREGRTFRDEELRILELFATQATVALENARLFAEVQQRAQRLESLAHHLQARNVELDSFAYAVSHDLKAPLVTLQGMAGLLAEDCGRELGERGAHYLARLGSTVGHMERLIGDVLMLSRIGREGRATETVSLDEVVDGVLLGLASTLGARGVEVTRGELGSIRAVRTQIEQVFSNLIGNAVKYLGDAAAPAIEIGSTERNGAREYFVRDNGVGIDAAYHAKIFETFERLKEVDAEGSGLGLAIVKKIVETAGGRIRVESAAGQGATFFFTWLLDE